MGAVDYEIIVVGWETCRCPAWIRGMAGGAGRRDVIGCMIGVSGAVVSCKMASHAGVRCGIIIPVMALVTAYGGMAPCERVIIIVYRECRRQPAWIRSMADIAGGGYVGCCMIRVCGPVICC